VRTRVLILVLACCFLGGRIPEIKLGDVIFSPFYGPTFFLKARKAAMTSCFLFVCLYGYFNASIS
jgi:hypothetical protein